MRATASIILREFGGLGIHQSRLKAVAAVTSGIVGCGRMALTSIGRCLDGRAKARHGIKRVDRLLGNTNLAKETGLFFQHLASRMISFRGRPILLIDWTDIGKAKWAALVVTLVSEGRGVVLFSEVHPRRKENNPRVETSVLRELERLLPGGCKPILITDAGFRGPWLKKVIAKGWDFVGRIRGRVHVQRVGESNWQPLKSHWHEATARPRDWGEYLLAQYEPVKARFVAVWKNKSKKKSPTRKIGRRSQVAIRRAREPWILVTSLRVPAQEIVRLYGLRMRIELTFRDQKCARFGLTLEQIRTNNANRVKIYLLLAALAHYVLMFVGRCAERANLHRDYQANTQTSRRVLSWPRLGREVLQRAMRQAESCMPQLPARLAVEIFSFAP